MNLNLEYTFEKMFDGKYQVRLAGEFICFCVVPDPDYVDEKLFQFGFKSREEFLDMRWEELLQSL